jgi:hypothetical protein
MDRKLQDSPVKQQPTPSYWANRQLLPEFIVAEKAGAYRPKPGDVDITDIISEDREALDQASPVSGTFVHSV